MVERTLRTFWALPLLLIVASFGITTALLFADREGAAARVKGWGPPFGIPADTAADLASTILSIAIALTTLMVSITLIVLTIAAGNLGIRFIDRWVRARTTRLSIGVWPALSVAALLVLYAIEEGDAPYVPRLSLMILVAAFCASLAYLTSAFHHLSRLMQVDVSLADIAHDIARDAGDGPGDPPSDARTEGSLECAPAHAIGYVEALDTDGLLARCEEAGLRVVVLRPVGSFVLRGTPVLGVLGDGGADAVSLVDAASLVDASERFVSITAERRESEGARFQVHLLVEAAIRAISPAVNDQYTAIDAAHRLAACFAQAFKTEAPLPGTLLDRAGRGLLHYPPVSILSALDEAMVIFRRTARDHPSVVCAFLDHAAQAGRFARRDEERDLLRRHGEALAAEAIEASGSALDREALTASRDALRAALASPHPLSLPRAA